MITSGLCPQDALFLISGETRPELYFFSTQTHSSVWTKGHLSSDLLENPNVATPGCSCHSDSHLQKSFSLPLSPVLRRCWRGCLLKVWGLGQFIPILLGLGCLVGKVDSQQDAVWVLSKHVFLPAPYFPPPFSFPPSSPFSSFLSFSPCSSSSSSCQSSLFSVPPNNPSLSKANPSTYMCHKNLQNEWV